MPNDKSLLAVVRGLRDREERASIATAIDRDDWLGACHALMRGLRAWLRPAEAEGLVHIEGIEVAQGEDESSYQAPGLKVTLPGGRTLWVRPSGMLSVGAKGWVDMTCGANRAMLVLNRKSVWKARGCDPLNRGAKLEPLDESRFTELFAELVE